MALTARFTKPPAEQFPAGTVAIGRSPIHSFNAFSGIVPGKAGEKFSLTPPLGTPRRGVPQRQNRFDEPPTSL